MSLLIEFLADHPELVSDVARWFYDEWGSRDPTRSVDLIEKEIGKRLNRDNVPIVYIAFLESKPVGSASLILHEMETHPQYIFWMASVYVRPSYRNRGIGSQLVTHMVKEGKRLGLPKLTLYTHSHEDFYARLGWVPVERPQYRGRQVVIMVRDLLDEE